MKIYCHIEASDWIIDRIGKEFKEFSSHDVSSMLTYGGLFDFDLIWLCASFDWRRITPDKNALLKFYSETPVLCTVHHIVPWKWNQDKYNEFMLRDQFVDMYHTYTEAAASIIKQISNKPVVIMPHWVNSNIWFSMDKNECRDFLKIRRDSFVIGSFQRDTESSDLISPKLEKGPDIFVEICKKIYMNEWNVEVLLGGNRRQYIINNLESLKIPYKYFEKAEIETVNKMYSACDLYVVSSRCEGGPQSIFESSITRTNIISTDVGQSRLILDKECIYSIADGNIDYKIPGKSCVDTNYENVIKYDIKNHVKNYDNLMTRASRVV